MWFKVNRVYIHIIVLKDTDTLEKFDLLVNYAVLQKLFHTEKNKIELGKQMLHSEIELTYLVAELKYVDLKIL